MGKLLPCPFCGNDGSGPIEDALHISLNEHEWRGPSWTVQCDKCTATMGYSDTEDAAIEAWNTRAPLSKDALIEAERRGAERMRERAAQEQEDCWKHGIPSVDHAKHIRALPLTEETPDDA